MQHDGNDGNGCPDWFDYGFDVGSCAKSFRTTGGYK